MPKVFLRKKLFYPKNLTKLPYLMVHGNMFMYYFGVTGIFRSPVITPLLTFLVLRTWYRFAEVKHILGRKEALKKILMSLF